jgi:hypothetical protein
LRAVVDAAQADSTPPRAPDAQHTRNLDLAVERRRTLTTNQRDPVIVAFFTDHHEFGHVMERLRRVLIGDDTGPEARVRTAMLIAAVSGTVMHPFVVDLDDDTLRAQLLHLARRFLGLSA